MRHGGRINEDHSTWRANLAAGGHSAQSVSITIYLNNTSLPVKHTQERETLEERGFHCTDLLSHLQAHLYAHKVMELERARYCGKSSPKHGANDVLQSGTIQIH